MKKLLALLLLPILLLAACSSDSDDKSDDGGDKPAKTTTTEAEDEDEDEGDGEALALDEWIDEANALCVEGEEAEDELPLPSEDLEELAVYLEELLALEEDQVAGFQELGVPDDEEAAELVDEAYALLDDLVAVLEEAAAAAADGDQDGVDAAFAEAEELGARLDELAAEIGIDECISEGEEDTTDTSVFEDGGEPVDPGDIDLEALFLDQFVANGIPPEQAECILDSLLTTFTEEELVEIGLQISESGVNPPEFIDAVTAATLECV